MSFLDLIESDIDNQHFNDIKLQSSDGDMIPCSRGVLCMRSSVFESMVGREDFPNDNIFPSPFPGWVLRQIRHLCYFGSFELDKLEGHGEEGIRKLTRMLVALDFYGIESSLAGSIVFKLYTTMNQEPGLACAVLDEFGHDGVEMKDEQRNLIVKAVGRAMMLLRNTPLPMLLPNSSDAIVGGIACIQDTRTVSKLLSELQLMPHIKAQTEFQVLDAWARSASNSTEAANKLLEESGVLARFVKEDPAVFSDPVGIVFKSSWIKSTELALDALHKHVCSVKTKESSSRKASPPSLLRLSNEHLRWSWTVDEW